MIVQAALKLRFELVQRAKNGRFHAAFFFYWSIAVSSGIGLFGKINLIQHVFRVPVPVAWGLCIAGVLAPAGAGLALRYRWLLAPLALAGFACTIMIVFPRIEALHEIGRGSDQADCVIVAGNLLLAGHWPYQRELLWSHNPMSCGPGWVAMQAPLVRRVGYRGDLLAIWFCSLAGLVFWMGWKVVLNVLSLFFLCAGFWLALANGTDFLSFGICIAAITMILETADHEMPWLLFLSSLVVQFRFPVVFLPMFMRRHDRQRWGIIATLIAVTCFLGFLIWRPHDMIADGPLFLLHKMTPFLGGPALGKALFAIAALLCGGFVLALWLRRYLSGAWAVFIYMLMLFGVPALLDLIVKLLRGPSIPAAIGSWEGGMWLVACLPLAALLLVRQLPD